MPNLEYRRLRRIASGLTRTTSADIVTTEIRAPKSKPNPWYDKPGASADLPACVYTKRTDLARVIETIVVRGMPHAAVGKVGGYLCSNPLAA